MENNNGPNSYDGNQDRRISAVQEDNSPANNNHATSTEAPTEAPTEATLRNINWADIRTQNVFGENRAQRNGLRNSLANPNTGTGDSEGASDGATSNSRELQRRFRELNAAVRRCTRTRLSKQMHGGGDDATSFCTSVWRRRNNNPATNHSADTVGDTAAPNFRGAGTTAARCNDGNNASNRRLRRRRRRPPVRDS